MAANTWVTKDVRSMLSFNEEVMALETQLEFLHDVNNGVVSSERLTEIVGAIATFQGELI